MKIVICGQIEDPKCSEQSLLEMAQKYSEPVEVQRMATEQQLLFHIDPENSDVDLIYLEYDLEDNNGVKTACLLREKSFSADIVFFTDNEDHICEGYDVDALHYLIKNKVTNEKFEEVFYRAIKRAKQRNEKALSLFCAGETRKIQLGSIQYFETNRRMVTVHYGNHEEFVFYSTLSRLEELLFGKGFIRVHQAFLVSQKHIRQRNKDTVIMADNTAIPIGRSFQKKIQEIYGSSPKIRE